jgi:arylsulfatase A-like enzyme
LIVISVDTWRADFLDLYGGPVEVPVLSELAAEGVRFDRALTPAPWTLPTVASLMTGLTPGSHAATEPHLAVCEEADTLAEVLTTNGWTTAFVGINEYFLPEDSGLRQGFGTWWAQMNVPDRDAVAAALDSMEASQGKAAFLHVHLYGPHSPFESHGRAVTPGTVKTWRNDIDRRDLESACIAGADGRSVGGVEAEVGNYRAELEELDTVLGELRDGLRALNRWDQAWVIVVGDHGEEFCEHRSLGHGDTTHEETLRVPLVVRPPSGSVMSRGRVGEAMSVVDVPATLLAAAQIDVPKTWASTPLHRFWESEVPLPQTVLSSSTLRNGSNRLVTETGSVVVDCCGGALRPDGSPSAPEVRVYANGDVDEESDLVSRMSSPFTAVRVFKQLAAIASEWAEEGRDPVCAPTTIGVDTDHLEQLRALGYIGD